jgi:predicted DNA-binding WGR domain protein
MRAFVQGEGPDRKYVCIEVLGRTMIVVSGRGNNAPPRRQEKQLSSEREAQAAAEKLSAEMRNRGFVERPPGNGNGAKPRGGPAKAKPGPVADVAPLEEPEDNYALVEALDEPAAPAPILPRGPAPASQEKPAASKSKAARKKKKKKRAKEPGEKPDLLFIGGISTASLVLVGVLGWFIWSMFFKPVSIVGTWAGSRVDKEPGGPIIYNQYRLALNEQGRARMVLQDSLEMAGTYKVQGDRLKLNFTDEDGDTSATEYKIILSSVTLTLIEPDSGKTVVELIRQREMDKLPGAGKAGPAAKAPPGALPELDANLVTQSFTVKDGAFSCKHPDGWEVESGSRPDNTYSWAKFTKGSATLRINADVTGSLIADIEKSFGGEGEGDESPVASAHEMARRTASEEFDDYKEGAARSITSPGLGDGRIAEFEAGGSGLLSTHYHGYRATLLTQNRRLTILCWCPEKQWDALKPTFFAFIQGVKR